jgi:predicted DCC family thiol-disulfide oxidoreductase YuxK
MVSAERPRGDTHAAKPTSSMPTLTLIYDSDCGFCRWCLGKVLAWDRRRVVRPVALGTPEANRLLAEVPAAEQPKSWHLVDSDGQVRSAGAGFPPLLQMLPGGGPLAAATAKLPGATESAYRFISGNRSLWGKLVTDGAKRRADKRIAGRLRHKTAATSGRPT